MFSLMRSLPDDLTYAARGEPEHVLHQAVSVRMEGHKLLLDKLLAALGAQPWGYAAQATTVVRAAIQVTVIILLRELLRWTQPCTYMHTSDRTSCWNWTWSGILTMNIQSPAQHTL